jgi:pyroglutamyl-peptidase
MNYRSADKPDNAGRLVTGTPIDKHQPDGIFSQLPVEGLVTSLNSIGIPASLSFNAGAYLCNNAMFIIVREARKRGFAGGFVHLPCHTEWVARRNSKSPSLPIGLIQSAAEHCVTYSLRTLKRNRS